MKQVEVKVDRVLDMLAVAIKEMNTKEQPQVQSPFVISMQTNRSKIMPNVDEKEEERKMVNDEESD